MSAVRRGYDVCSSRRGRCIAIDLHELQVCRRVCLRLGARVDEVVRELDEDTYQQVDISCGTPSVSPKGDEHVKLFTFATSPYARKVRIVLDYKGIPYEPIERCYSLDRKENLRAASKRAEVPAIVLDDGRTIADSTIICEYLEQVYPTPPIYPKDAYERARMRSLEDLCDRTFDAIGFGTSWRLFARTRP